MPTDVGTTATSPNSALISGVSSAYRGVLSWYQTAPEVASPPARRTASTMNSFWVMSRISAGITSGSFKSASTVIRGPSRLLYAGVGTIHLLVSRCAYPALAEDPCAAGGQRGRERVRSRHPGGDLAVRCGLQQLPERGVGGVGDVHVGAVIDGHVVRQDGDVDEGVAVGRGSPGLGHDRARVVPGDAEDVESPRAGGGHRVAAGVGDDERAAGDERADLVAIWSELVVRQTACHWVTILCVGMKKPAQRRAGYVW